MAQGERINNSTLREKSIDAELIVFRDSLAAGKFNEQNETKHFRPTHFWRTGARQRICFRIVEIEVASIESEEETFVAAPQGRHRQDHRAVPGACL